MRVLNLLRKDLLQIWRDPKTFAFMLIMPLAFTAFFGYIFAPGADADPRLRVAIIDRDPGGALSEDIFALFDKSEAIRPVRLSTADEGRVERLVTDDKLAAAVIIPQGYSNALLDGRDLPLETILDRATAVGQAALPAVQSVLLRLLGAAEAARNNAEIAGAAAPFTDDAARRAFVSAGLRMALQAWEQPSLRVVMQAAGPDEQKESAYGTNPYTQASPGMIVQFAVYGLMTSGGALVLERKSGTLKRLLTTPISRAGILSAKALGMLVMVLVQIGVLVLVGHLVFKVGYLNAPLATLVVVLALALFSASLGMLISAVSRGPEQVIMWSLIAMFVLTALGGGWFPLEITGPTFSKIGHILPMAWAMDGLQNIALRGQGLESVLLPAAVLLGYAAVCTALAVWRFRYE